VNLAALGPRHGPSQHSKPRSAKAFFSSSNKPSSSKTSFGEKPPPNTSHPAEATLEHWDGAIALFHEPREIARFFLGRDARPRVAGQERVCRVSSLRDETVDDVDSFGPNGPNLTIPPTGRTEAKSRKSSSGHLKSYLNQTSIKAIDRGAINNCRYPRGPNRARRNLSADQRFNCDFSRGSRLRFRRLITLPLSSRSDARRAAWDSRAAGRLTTRG